ncbi:MAG: hypothetical protein KDA91_15890 [Planctomycetaceae bacterium]|nr:hypothetical protein [Planctomycetaceae bacterium]
MTDARSFESIGDQIDAGSSELISLPEELLPEELRQQPERLVPHWIYRCRRIRRPWIASWCGISIFLLAILLGANPVGTPWQKIAFWPAAIIGSIGFVGVLISRSSLRYVKYGIVGTAVIEDVLLEPVQHYNGQTVAYHHAVLVSLPTTDGRVFEHEFRGLGIMAGQQEFAELRMRVGDRVPVIWLQGQFRKTAQLYGFLPFNEDVSLMRKPKPAGRWRKNLLTGIAVVGIFAVLFLNLYLMMNCVPVAMSVPIVAAVGIIGGIVLGGSALAYILHELKSEQQRMHDRNLLAIASGRAFETGSPHVMLTNTVVGWTYWIVCAAGSLLLGGLTVGLWAFGLNMYFDSGAARARVVVVDAAREVDQGREWEISFHPKDEPNIACRRSFPVRRMPPVNLKPGGEFTVDWHPGRFGWPWIDNIR